MTKYIFVMGGVISSLGKGIASSSIGLLLKKMGYEVGMIKLDPYLNVDPGTMSPFQHGEVFVTEDGAESDLDLGHYERFLDKSMGKHSNTTSGQIYESVIYKERRGDYLGKTVQVIPHVTNEIIYNIRKLEEKNEIILVEIGGTVGDIESLPFLEAVRQLRLELGPENSIYVYLTFVPYIRSAGELKTKPTQHSVYKLREIGIQPDILLCRSHLKFTQDIINKISLFTNVPKQQVFNAIDVETVYRIPLVYDEAGLPQIVCDLLHIEYRKPELSDWEELVDSILNPVGEVTIAVCGKYVVHKDAYKSIEQALIHAGAYHRLKVKVIKLDSEHVHTHEQIDGHLKDIDGILIPGGFGPRGIGGKINIAGYARRKNIPYFGICLGMQVAVIEFAKNACGLQDAFSTEFDETCDEPVICLMEDHKYVEKYGGTMRLGAQECRLVPDSMAARIYQSDTVSERHRHRLEFNNEYREVFDERGMKISGTTMDGMLVEIVELVDHPFFIGVQFHPEFQSRPNRPHPIFRDFLSAAKKQRDKRVSEQKPQGEPS